jgi:membrane associated rhomboid family serine protease
MQAVDDDIVSFGKRPSRFVRGLMVVCAAVYIVEFFMRATLDRAVLLRMGANSPGLVDHQQWWRLMTSTFLHGSWFHLLFSLVALGTVGAQLERWLGWRAFAFLYLGSCFGGAYVSNLWAGGPLSVGSSTGLYGLLGVLAVSAWIFRDAPLAGPRVNAGQVVFLVITAALMNFMPNIDMAAHIGGFCTGAFLALFLVPRPVDGPLLRPQALFLASSLMVGAYALAIVDGVQHGLSKYTDFALEERVALSEKHHNRAALLQYTQRIYEMPDPTRADLARGLEVARRAVALNGQDVEARKIEAAFVARLRELPPGHK